MPRRPTRLALAAGVLLALGGACMGFQDESIVYQSLNYTIDRPRVLAISASPPVLVSGRTVLLDALVLAPDGASGDGGTWSTCYLDEETWIAAWTLDCFMLEGVPEIIAEGLPATWVVPDLPAAAAAEARPGPHPDDDDTGWTWEGYQVPFLLEATVGDDTVSGVLDAFVRAEPPAGGCERSLRDLDLTLEVGDADGGEVALEACLGAPCGQAVFRWYVDDGTLLGTARTAIHRREADRVCSSNTWVLPEGVAAPLRVAVVLAATEVNGCEDAGSTECFAMEAGDMTWALSAWEGP
jgi:hypothetical protein